MTDLFASMQEHALERAALQADLHKCEVQSVIRRFFPDGTKAAAYFAEVEKMRGKESADKLRADCRVAWAKHRSEIAGQG